MRNKGTSKPTRTGRRLAVALAVVVLGVIPAGCGSTNANHPKTTTTAKPGY